MEDDFCAVCADTLEWVAYGACGHKDVCSTCVARLRFICGDSSCCICKSHSDVVFVTKALGDYTNKISDFSILPSQPKEGRVGSTSYWYHEDTQAFFDDADQYKMVKAMCKLSCSVCDKKATEEPTDQVPGDGASRRRTSRFRNIEQLKGHLFHQHKKFMCSLCLEGRKVFICEQKLYSRSQLTQHTNTGDSVVDGSESERGGFMGHPKCEFCRTPFYGDNELYSHMSTEHFTCHICQRQHPGQYEYYKDYDDLEIHFRRDHFLCEDDSCLAKKFIVFPSESELKRHNALEHGGHMSRSQRNAALQLPTSFRYRRGNEQERNRGRGRSFQRDTSEHNLSAAIQACLEASNLDSGTVGELPLASSNTRQPPVSVELSEVDPLVTPTESLSTDADLPSRYREALSLHSRNSELGESAFPPLPVAAPGGSSQSRSIQSNSMAAHLRRQNKVKVINSSSSSLAGAVGGRTPLRQTGSPPHGLSNSSSWSGLTSQSASAFPNSSQDRSTTLAPDVQQSWPALNVSSRSAMSTSGPSKLVTTENGPPLSSYSSSVLARPSMINESSSSRGSSGKVIHSASAPNLVESGSFRPSNNDFPPVSAVQPSQKSRPGNAVSTTTVSESVHTANKSLVERIRTALDFDQDKYSSFKDISAEYRQGSIDAEMYLVYVEQFGLSHLVFELARLCPDVQKQKELIETYNANMAVDDGKRENGKIHLKSAISSKKGKEKADTTASSTASKDKLADSILSTVKQLQSSYTATIEDEVEILSKDGYRAASKGKEKVAAVTQSQSQAELSSSDKSTNAKDQDENQRVLGENVGGRNNKQKKKMSKFHRVRLGDGSAAAILDLNRNGNSEADPDPDLNAPSSESLPVRGVWHNGGGQKLFSTTATSRGPKK